MLASNSSVIRHTEKKKEKMCFEIKGETHAKKKGWDEQVGTGLQKLARCG